jgi:hypothetical protein
MIYMARMDEEHIMARTVAVIDSILADLASGREKWSNPEVFLSLGRDIASFSYRLAEDSENLAEVSVKQVRDGVVNDLGSAGYAYLLEIPAEERREIAMTMLAVETDGCAAENYQMPTGIDRSFAGRLPLPLPYVIASVAPHIYITETAKLAGGLLDDVRAGRTAWDSVAGTEPSALPQLLRNAYLSLLAQAAQPRDIRDNLERVLGRPAFSRLLGLDEPGSTELARSVYENIYDLDNPRDIEDLNGRGADLPGIFIAIASWAAAQFGKKDADVVTRAILADVAARSDEWRQLDAVAAGGLSPVAAQIVSGISEKPPARIHERLAASFGADFPDRLLNLPDRACSHLGGALYYAARPSRWDDNKRPRFPGEPGKVESEFYQWCKRWHDGDQWLMDAINRP